ncbi:DUF3558 family protein [Amycolatopsis sp. cmx-8-4]|uniref:DUF3558 family protein n=1 Tax=Amycolatopsis sp. cmx-8-4 TaxID=2790947 RepID=UPI003979E756
MAVVAAVAIFSCACTGKGSNDGTTSLTNAPSASDSETPSPSNLPYAGAPPVASPLPASALSGNPCVDALPSAKAEEFLGAPLKTERNDNPEFGAGCSWANQDRGSQIGVTYDTKTGSGLSGVFQNTQPQSGIWKPLSEIQGFPAVAHAGTKGTTPRDYCQVSIGLANDLSADVTLNLGTAKVGTVDPCDGAADVANAVVVSLKAKAGS